jgi:hypothetical protein
VEQEQLQRVTVVRRDFPFCFTTICSDRRYRQRLRILSRGRRRWNAPGIYAIYGSIEPGLAADESFNFLLQKFGWQNRDIPPRMMVGIRVSLQTVLDLTNPANALHQLNLEELLSEDWRKMNTEQKESRSQTLGRVVAWSAAIAEVWRRGSVIASWLLDLTADGLLKDPELPKFSGQVSDSSFVLGVIVSFAWQKELVERAASAQIFTIEMLSRQSKGWLRRVGRLPSRR